MKTANNTKSKNGDIIEFLKAKKAKDGKLNKLGEWILSGQSTGWEIADNNMRYVLK